MRKRYIRDNRGSITLFVLLSCLFFLITITSVGIFVKNKESAVESDYQRIKQSYYNYEENEINEVS